MDDAQHNQAAGRAMHAPQALPELPEPFEPAADSEALARDLVALRTVAPDTGIGSAIMRRFDTSGAPGLHAAGLGGRFAPRAMRAAPLQLTVSPYAPPQRQISAARQGAPMWRPQHVTAQEPATDHTAPASPAPPPRASAADPNELPADLRRLLDLHRARGNI